MARGCVPRTDGSQQAAPVTLRAIIVTVQWYLRLMTKEKVTVTLDADRLGELRALVGSRSLSATIDVALAAHLERLRHLAAVDEWLAELDSEHGPVPARDLQWAAREVGAWLDGRDAGQRAG